MIVGHGPQREVIDTILWALENGEVDWLRDIAAWGAALEGGGGGPYETAARYFATLEEEGALAAYADAGLRHVRADRVIFTGYLTHAELRYLMPCADVAVFPSVVKEAGPLVFLEAMASGVFPLGTYVGGMAASIDAVADRLAPEPADLMKISADPASTVRDLVEKTPKALALCGRYRDVLRDAVIERNDWQRIAAELAGDLLDMNAADASFDPGRKKEGHERVPG